MANQEQCPLCHDRGFTLINDTAVPCSCLKQRELENKFKRSRLSPGMRGLSFADFQARYYSKDVISATSGKSNYQSAQLLLQACRKFCQDFKRDQHTDGMLLTGNVGSGKTLLAVCIANQLLQDGEEVLFLNVPDLLEDLRATYDNSSDYTEQQLMDSARKVPLLILDDLGAHNYSEWVKGKLYSIINYRTNNQLATIITSNTSLEYLSREEYLGERTTSRIYQLCVPYRLQSDDDIRILKRINR